MTVLVLLFLSVILIYLLIQRTALRKTNRTTRWLAYGIYALTGGLWVVFFMWTDHVHLGMLIQKVLLPFVPIKS
jgi:hypothetical protein